MYYTAAAATATTNGLFEVELINHFKKFIKSGTH